MTILSNNTVIPDDNGDVSIDKTNPKVIITSPTAPINLTISLDTKTPKIDLSSLPPTTTGTKTTVIKIPEINITSPLAKGIIVNIPKTTITGNTGWKGVLEAPTAKTETVPTPDGYSSTKVTSAIAIGSSLSDLTFYNPVKITFTGQAGQLVGWYDYTGKGTFTKITNTCNSLSTSLILPTGMSSCKINANNNKDLIVLTKHFSTFVTYTQTPIITNAGGGSSAAPASSPAPVVSAPVVSAPVVSAPVVSAPTVSTPSASQGKVLGAEAFNFTQFLSQGLKGNGVKELQKKLTIEGVYTGPITGYFGPLTKKAVQAYQKKNGLKADGLVGANTRAKLDAVIANTNANGKVLGAEAFNFTQFLSQGSKGNEVKELQKFLNEAGYNSGIIDGVFGQKTKSALVNFQTANGLEADGIVGPNTRNALDK